MKNEKERVRAAKEARAEAVALLRFYALRDEIETPEVAHLARIFARATTLAVDVGWWVKE